MAWYVAYNIISACTMVYLYCGEKIYVFIYRVTKKEWNYVMMGGGGHSFFCHPVFVNIPKNKTN